MPKRRLDTRSRPRELPCPSLFANRRVPRPKAHAPTNRNLKRQTRRPQHLRSRSRSATSAGRRQKPRTTSRSTQLRPRRDRPVRRRTRRPAPQPTASTTRTSHRLHRRSLRSRGLLHSLRISANTTKRGSKPPKVGKDGIDVRSQIVRPGITIAAVPPAPATLHAAARPSRSRSVS